MKKLLKPGVLKLILTLVLLLYLPIAFPTFECDERKILCWPTEHMVMFKTPLIGVLYTIWNHGIPDISHNLKEIFQYLTEGIVFLNLVINTLIAYIVSSVIVHILKKIKNTHR